MIEKRILTVNHSLAYILVASTQISKGQGLSNSVNQYGGEKMKSLVLTLFVTGHGGDSNV